MPQSSQTPTSKQESGVRRRGPCLPLEQRLERLTDRSGECWLWVARTSDGYGLLTLNGKQRLAHRVSYEFYNGPIPDGLQIDHLCRVRNCINPAHLEPVTAKENRRRTEPFRAPQPSRPPQAECIAGHPLSGDNLGVTGDRRYCRECQRRRNRESIRRVRAARRAEAAS